MTGAQDLFESFTVSDSGMYMELGMEDQACSTGIWNNGIWMESGDVL
jgi:hypothetical protein